MAQDGRICDSTRFDRQESVMGWGGSQGLRIPKRCRGSRWDNMSTPLTRNPDFLHPLLRELRTKAPARPVERSLCQLPHKAEL